MVDMGEIVLQQDGITVGQVAGTSRFHFVVSIDHHTGRAWAAKITGVVRTKFQKTFLAGRDPFRIDRDGFYEVETGAGRVCLMKVGAQISVIPQEQVAQGIAEYGQSFEKLKRKQMYGRLAR